MMCFIKPLNPGVYFSEKLIKQVATYEYLESIMRFVHRCNQDISAKKRDQAREAIFSLHIYIYIYN